MSRPRWEILIGNDEIMDMLADQSDTPAPPHPLQELVEEAVETQLTEDEQEIFWMRFGDKLSIRAIAYALGYTSHQIIQVRLERIKRKVKEYIEDQT